jgi:ABC-type molybdenum transport system ATPase subunit/photorepair protein PhrA
MGFVSPELQTNYREAMTGAEVIASGFFSSVGLMQRASREQKRKVAALVAALGLRELAARNILHMSYGEFRKVLLARALVQEPEVLICDEPFDGLDAPARADFARALEGAARRGANLVMVTHHLADLPRCITHVAELSAGRLTFAGAAAEYLARNGNPRRCYERRSNTQIP